MKWLLAYLVALFATVQFPIWRAEGAAMYQPIFRGSLLAVNVLVKNFSEYIDRQSASSHLYHLVIRQGQARMQLVGIGAWGKINFTRLPTSRDCRESLIGGKIANDHAAPMYCVYSWGLAKIFHFDFRGNRNTSSQSVNGCCIDMNIRSQLSFCGIFHYRNCSICSTRSVPRGERSDSSKNYRHYQRAELKDIEPKNARCPNDALLGGISHPPLFAKISFVMILGAGTVGLIGAGLFACLIGGGRRLGYLLLLLGVGAYCGSVAVILSI